MLKQSSINTRKKFLNNFTNEILAIVKNQQDSEEAARKAQERINRERDIQRLTKKYIAPEPKPTTVESEAMEIKKEIVKKPEQRKPIERPISKQATQIPTYKPMPGGKTIKEPFDLNKIQVLLDDPEVTSIECQGENKELIIKKRNQLMKTEIKLEKKDILEVIKQFSEKARIPLIEGLLRARVGDLQISAVVSEVTSSRFLITRVPLAQRPAPVMFQSQGFRRAPSQLQRPPIPQQQRPAIQPRAPMPPIQRPFAPQPQIQQPQIQQTPMAQAPVAQAPQPIPAPTSQIQQAPTPQPTEQPMPQAPMAPTPTLTPTQKTSDKLEGMQQSIASGTPAAAKEIPAPEKPTEKK